MEFVQQLREHRQRASEAWARDQFFTATSDKRTSPVSLPQRIALLARRLLTARILVVLIIIELLSRLLTVPLWLELPLLVWIGCIVLRLLCTGKRSAPAQIELVDHRRILGRPVFLSPEKEV